MSDIKFKLYLLIANEVQDKTTNHRPVPLAEMGEFLWPYSRETLRYPEKTPPVQHFGTTNHPVRRHQDQTLVAVVRDKNLYH